MKNLLALSFVLSITSCGEMFKNSESDLSLIGGQVIDSNSLSSFISISGCSAALAAPDVIVTAAHCIHDFAGSGKIKSKYQAGQSFRIQNSQTLGAVGSKTVTIKKSSVHPSWEKACTPTKPCDPRRAAAAVDAGVSDIAIIELTAPVSGIQPAKLDFTPVQANEAVTVAGYGCEQGVQSGTSGRRKSMDTKVVDGNQALAHQGSERANVIPATIESNFITPGQAQGGPSLCPGDSGGPVYRNDSIVGVNADYTFTGQYEAKGAIARTNIHTRVSKADVKQWLLEQAPQLSRDQDLGGQGSGEKVINVAIAKSSANSLFGNTSFDLHLSAGLTVSRMEFCSGQQSTSCPAGSVALLRSRASSDRVFFKSQTSTNLSKGVFTMFGKDAAGQVVAKRVIRLQ